MKKKLALLLVGVLSISAVGCGAKPEAPVVAVSEDAVSENEIAKEDVTEESTDSEEVADAEADSEVTGELIPGGTFDAESDKWALYTESGGSAEMSTTGGELVVKTANTGSVAHGVQIYCDGFELLQGGKYKISFDMSSTVPRTIEWRVQLNGGDYHAYAGDESIQLGPDMQNITREFTMEEASDPAPRLCFNIGKQQSGNEIGAHDIHLDNVSLMLIDGSNAQASSTGADIKDININQVGYKPSDEKIAIFRNAGADKTFEIVDKSGKSVYSGSVTGSYQSEGANETVAYGDFSDFKTPGTYQIKSDSGLESFAFTIGDDVYADVFADINKMMTMQRCGMELTNSVAGDFAHPACHIGKATTYPNGEAVDVSGGWHDAGDYGRYIAPAAKAVCDLMLAYEDNPSAFADDTGIPESGNKIADVLDEAKYELDWMLKMQFGDGSVSHKVTFKNFSGMVMPQDANDELVLLPVSNTATGDFAAAMFMAARVYKNVDASFAGTCQDAAYKALDYMKAHYNDAGFRNPGDVSTGEYPDDNAIDEYLWALCEGYKSTNDTAMLGMIKECNLDSITENGLGWQCVTMYAYYAYLTSKAPSDGVSKIMSDRFDACVKEIIDAINADGYHSSIRGAYPWGSNMTIANNGMILLMADKLHGNTNNEKLAKYQLDYLLGSGPTSYCFVTGYGSLSPSDTHHRPSQALHKTLPGMLVGGPDSNLEDPYAQATLSGKPAAMCYADNSQSYSCNEITIYWNSPLIYLLSGLK